MTKILLLFVIVFVAVRMLSIHRYIGFDELINSYWVKSNNLHNIKYDCDGLFKNGSKWCYMAAYFISLVMKIVVVSLALYGLKFV